MSYVVEIIRPIDKSEVVALVESDAELTVHSDGDDWIRITYCADDGSTEFYFAQARLSSTSPNEAAWKKLHDMAELLGARVIGEEDELPPPTLAEPRTKRERDTWLGWPLLVLILAILLWIKW